MNKAADWQRLNLEMIAKALQELSYEQILSPRRLDSSDPELRGPYELITTTGINYTFQAWQGIWTDLKVQTASLRRNGEIPPSAGQFFIDIQKETGMDDIVLSNFLEEMHNTLYADQAVLQKARGITVEEMLGWSGEKIQSVLTGHPKLLLNKGRIGWSAEDQDHYGPENEKAIQFLWLAVHPSICISGQAPELNTEVLLKESLQEDDFQAFKSKVTGLGLELHEYLYLPVHPWQWQRYLKIQFAAELAQGKIHFLGAFGDDYLPQISLRTFSNINRPEKMDIKLPLTILNTSAIRGIPGKYMAQGPALSRDLSALCQKDPDLATTSVLEEKAGVSVQHALYSQISGAPYRYNELFGVLWRQSSFSKLNPGEKAVIAGSLFLRDEQGQSLIGAYITASGVSTEEWLRAYFRNVVIPLYHLQAQYGLGIVAHGQNVVIRLKDLVPTGLLLKDFQGDLRMTTTSTALSHDLTRLPANYLIHDLVTGHFVTVLRFISEVLKECEQFAEEKFYYLLGQELKSYRATHPQLAALPHFKDINLLVPELFRVLVNKVRFKIGYADSAERPIPMLGENLKNPIYLSLYQGEVAP